MNETARQAANRRLAEALGYRVQCSGFTNGYGVPVVGYKLFAPDGLEMLDWDKYNGDLEGYAGEELAWSCVPDFCASVDACLSVLPEDVDFEMVALGNGGYGVYLRLADPQTGRYVQRFDGMGATRAEALANAVLAWAQAARASAPTAGDGGEDGTPPHRGAK